MNNNTPLWIREILQNDKPRTFSKPVSRGKIEIIPGNKNEVYSKSRAGKKIKIAFFRDGPFLPISTGAANSIYWMMNALADAGLIVYLFYSYRGWSPKKLFKNQKFTTALISPDDFYTNKNFLSELLNNFDIDICHFDSAEAVCSQKNLLPDKCKTIFEVHNIESDLIKQISPSSNLIERIKQKERRAFTLSDAVLVRSDKNYKEAVLLGCSENKLFKYRGGINVSAINYLMRSKLSNNTILFLGHLNYTPNQQAVEIICKKIAPNLDKKFLIAGNGAPKLKKFNSEKIKFLGLVKDLNKIFSKTDIALAPIVTGSGTRIKVLDYMAAGIPVVGTNLAVEGLEEEIKNCMIIEDNFNNYIPIIKYLYASESITKKMSEAGRNFVYKYRDWKFCINDVIKAYYFALK